MSGSVKDPGIRLRGEYGTPQFMSAYQAAVSKRPVPNAGKAVRDYLAQFGITAVCITSSAEIVTASPASLGRVSAVYAWWTRDRRTAHEVVQAIGQRPGSIEEATAEILAAAKRVDVIREERKLRK